jgi:hypothetical protein
MIGTREDVLSALTTVLRTLGHHVREVDQETGKVRFTSRRSPIGWLGQDLQARLEEGELTGVTTVTISGNPSEQRWGRGQGMDFGTSDRTAKKILGELARMCPKV